MINKTLFFLRIYKLLIVYAPFLLINAMIVFVYVTYILNYILYITHDLVNNYISYQPNAMLNPNDFFIINQMPYYVAYVGICIFVIVTWCSMLMLLSFHRACFSNPGFLPNPVEFEIKLILPSFNTNELSNNTNNLNTTQLNMTSIAGLNAKMSRATFIQKFSQMVENGPLTNNEFSYYKKTINHFLLPRLNQNNQQLQSNNNNKNSNKNDTHLDMSRNSISMIQEKPLFELEKTMLAEKKTVDIHSLALCPNCSRWKPERCHHCRQCNKCVMKMDHHCPWLGNCVGLYNYKYFGLALIYGFISSSIVLLTFWEYVFAVNLSINVTTLYCIWNTFAYMCNLILFLFVGYLASINWTLVFNNMTTIEKADRQRFASSSSNSYYLGDKKLNKYDKGKWKNFKAVFGRNPLLWFIPVTSLSKEDGLVFE